MCNLDAVDGELRLLAATRKAVLDWRAELRGRLNSQWRLVRAVKHLDRGLPGNSVEADLEELRDYLNAEMHRFLVPRYAHIEVLIRSINDVLAALAVARHPPRNDTVPIPPCG